MAFLRWRSGVYVYRKWVTKGAFWLAAVFLIGWIPASLEAVGLVSMSPYGAIRAVILPFLCLYIIWALFVIAFKFREVRIDATGLRILPIGVHIKPEQITRIEISENYAGAERLELSLKERRLLPHLLAWSLGRKVLLSFNDSVIRRQ